MLAKTVDVEKTSLKELLALVREGSEVLLTEGDTPVAKIVPIEKKPGKRIMGLHAGMWEVSDDFDDPLPDEFWLGEE
jgi:antitoxin (DNA-binding transcriptional repressor) of toxin-antitoxin stability system